MAVNRRLIYWLIKAYIKKWRKTFFLFFLIGLAFFFILRYFISSFIAKVPLVHKEVIGSVGAYTVDTLPSFVLQDLSRGLTSVDKIGNPHPDLATSWEISDNGKTYVFHLRHGISFVDGTPFTAKEIPFAFSDVTIQRPDPYTIVFRLKDSYAPFLVNISRPIFKGGFVGIGKYKVTDIRLNGTFVASISTIATDNPLAVRLYQFYPTQESLKIAFVLGNITKAVGLTDLTFKDMTFRQFPNAEVTKQTNFTELVTLFYNSQDKLISDKLLRDALSYAIPNSFSEGQRATSPISPQSWAYAPNQMRLQDLDHAKLLLQDVIKQDSLTKIPTITVDVLPQYNPIIKQIASSWKEIGIQIKVKEVKSIPLDGFQIFLGNFNVPRDPDQYSLWHSDQNNNITGYKNVRIDKLLEDGRKILDQTTRLKTYADFQKYLLDDQPASFLYFPFTYTVARK